jgi:hypothetical protein
MADGYGSSGAGRLQVRAPFIFGLQLGMRDRKAECLLDLPQTCDSALISLLGAVVDGWRLKARRHWPRSLDAGTWHAPVCGTESAARRFARPTATQRS